MNILYLIGIVILTSFVAGIYKVEDAQTKERHRKILGEQFAFLSNKGYMQFIFFLFMVPLFFSVSWSSSTLLLLVGLSLLRFVPWVIVAVAKGRYKNTAHQASSNFTMLENFAGPIGALFVYGISNYLSDSHVSIGWYILTPFIGIFLLWALREKESMLSREMIMIIALQAVLVAAETLVVIYLQREEIAFVRVPDFLHSFAFVDRGMVAFLVVIAFSALWISLYFLKDIIAEARSGVGKDAVKIGVIAGLHDVVYFMSFIYFGPIFIIARRGMIIPMQNLYLGIKKGKRVLDMLRKPFVEPLLGLEGGKDFIISFVDLAFNRIVKVVIALST